MRENVTAHTGGTWKHGTCENASKETKARKPQFTYVYSYDAREPEGAVQRMPILQLDIFNKGFSGACNGRWALELRGHILCVGKGAKGSEPHKCSIPHEYSVEAANLSQAEPSQGVMFVSSSNNNRESSYWIVVFDVPATYALKTVQVVTVTRCIFPSDLDFHKCTLCNILVLNDSARHEFIVETREFCPENPEENNGKSQQARVFYVYPNGSFKQLYSMQLSSVSLRCDYATVVSPVNGHLFVVDDVSKPRHKVLDVITEMNALLVSRCGVAAVAGSVPDLDLDDASAGQLSRRSSLSGSLCLTIDFYK
ncbi:hypothetical protein Pelo_18758 [Pelomyxa schiedti]|nr:hypothetical protein Pelo_18758 [Pelomyxa schiedti]